MLPEDDWATFLVQNGQSTRLVERRGQDRDAPPAACLQWLPRTLDWHRAGDCCVPGQGERKLPWSLQSVALTVWEHWGLTGFESCLIFLTNELKSLKKVVIIYWMQVHVPATSILTQLPANCMKKQWMRAWLLGPRPLHRNLATVAIWGNRWMAGRFLPLPVSPIPSVTLSK